ncbi:MAG: hypothetical protein RBG13Loki_4282 [Promethearchaeota archaeon CR_4]|nr:MAG: hypothetical protein RBG13Loki_4282 [Candidatus Lokiarchaeota archaeon CR_4]
MIDANNTSTTLPVGSRPKNLAFSHQSVAQVEFIRVAIVQREAQP